MRVHRPTAQPMLASRFVFMDGECTWWAGVILFSAVGTNSLMLKRREGGCCGAALFSHRDLWHMFHPHPLNLLYGSREWLELGRLDIRSLATQPQGLKQGLCEHLLRNSFLNVESWEPCLADKIRHITWVIWEKLNGEALTKPVVLEGMCLVWSSTVACRNKGKPGFNWWHHVFEERNESGSGQIS